MKKYILLVCVGLVFSLQYTIPNPLQAQKAKTVEFSADGLPEQLLEYMNKSTSSSDKQKENSKIIKAFRPVYDGLESGMQDRLVALYAYAMQAKMKGNPEMSTMTRLFTTFATTPALGSGNVEGYLTSLESFKTRNAKPKALMDYLDFCDQLISERVLHRSTSCGWYFDKGVPFRLDVEGGVAVVRFETAADLHYTSAKDAGTIYATRGVYDYKECEWRGEGGRIDWVRTGLAAATCYADLQRYTVNAKLPKFSADSVSFMHTGYFTAAIPGRIEEQLSTPQEPEKYSYPRFRSYQRDFVIPDIMPEVDYSGSFMMNGSKFITASSKHPASLIFRKDGRRRMTVTSLKFVVTPTRLTADNAAVALYLGTDDSISNTGIDVRYQPDEKKVTLINNAGRNYYSPYTDSYHNLDIFSERIVWRIDRDDLLFSSLSATGAVSMSTFESTNYYTQTKLREINGIDAISPVKRVYEYMSSMGSEFGINGFADYIGLDISQAKLMIHNLTRHGLVTYNENTGRVQTKDKLVDYQMANSRNREYDYDALTFQSVTDGTNARLSFGDTNLVVRGVNKFVVSDSQRVVVYPDSLRGYEVAVGRNRTLHFSGEIHVGKFILTVTDCDFDYESYSFNMPRIEHLEFYVPDFEQPDKIEQLVRTPLSNLVGTLAVDKPDNHSGLTRNKDYPIFNSLEESRVFYDRKEIQGRQYSRDRFYYILRPFTIQNMVRFVTDSLQFNGVLVSAGIFPDIEEPLRVQRDYYLGFRIETPGGGYPAYGGKGTYSKELRLDHNGLRGGGDLQYLASRATSKNFLFLPDSTIGITDSFALREEGIYPDIRGGKTDLHWLPYADSMNVATTQGGRDLVMYRGDAALRGRVGITPQGASASGDATVLDATLRSDHFVLAPREMNADVSTFTLYSQRYKEMAFSASDVTSKVDYDGRIADIRSRSGVRLTNLPLLHYDAYADRFTWQMDRKELTLVNTTRSTSEGLEGLDLRMRVMKLNDMPGVRFVATDSKADGLTFHALQGNYYYDAARLSASGVYLIPVADAAIAPASDTLLVQKGGRIAPLAKAALVCNRTDGWHHIFNADLAIASASSYSGKGQFDYTDDLGRKQRLTLHNIEVKDGHTVAHGTISDSASFSLSSAFGFAGTVRLEGNHQWPYFDGGVRLIQPCLPANQLSLLAYSGYTDPEHVHVSVPEVPTDWKGRRITASILMDKQNLRPVCAFLTANKSADIAGNELLSAHGVLTYFGDEKMYMIGSEEKVTDPDGVVQPFLALSTADCSVEGEGLINFATRRSQASFYAYGTAHVGIQHSDDDHLTTVFGVTFPLAGEITKALGTNLKEDIRLEPIGITTNAEMRHAMMHHLGADKGAAAYALFSSTGDAASLPTEMRSMLLFDNIKWQYHPAMGLYYDGKVGLLTAGGENLGVEVTLKAQIYRRNNSQQMVLYVQATRDHWYYFKYDLGTQELTLYSSMGTWIDLIKSIPVDQRKISKEGLGTFRYFAGNNSSEVPNWLDWFSRTAYSGKE